MRRLGRRVSTIPNLLVKKPLQLLIGSTFFVETCCECARNLLTRLLKKKWLLHDDVIAEASTFPRLGSTRQYTIFEISASLFCMELKFTPEFQLNKWWNCIISSWSLLWSVLYTFKKSVLSRCCKRIYYSPAVQNTSILQTVV